MGEIVENAVPWAANSASTSCSQGPLKGAFCGLVGDSHGDRMTSLLETGKGVVWFVGWFVGWFA